MWFILCEFGSVRPKLHSTKKAAREARTFPRKAREGEHRNGEEAPGEPGAPKLSLGRTTARFSATHHVVRDAEGRYELLSHGSQLAAQGPDGARDIPPSLGRQETLRRKAAPVERPMWAQAAVHQQR